MQVIRPEHKQLMSAYSVFKKHGWIVERGDRSVYSGVVEIPVRLVSADKLSPWFYGQCQINEKNIIQAQAGAELVALVFAAHAYDIPFSQDSVDIPEQEDVSAEGLSKHQIVHEMGSTVSDVESRLYSMGVDMSSYNAYRDKLNAQGKRMTKEKMAEYFFPRDRKPRVVVVNTTKASETIPVVAPHKERVFRVDL